MRKWTRITTRFPACPGRNEMPRRMPHLRVGHFCCLNSIVGFCIPALSAFWIMHLESEILSHVVTHARDSAFLRPGFCIRIAPRFWIYNSHYHLGFCILDYTFGILHLGFCIHKKEILYFPVGFWVLCLSGFWIDVPESPQTW